MKRAAPVLLVLLSLVATAYGADAVFGTGASPTSIELAPVQSGAPPATFHLEYDPTFDEEVANIGFNWIPNEQHKWTLQIERDPCLPAGCGAGSWRQAEIHVGEFLTPDGATTRRPISATVRLDNYFTKILFSGQTNFLSEDMQHAIAQIYWGGAPVVEVAAGGYLSLRQGGALVMRDSGDVLRSIAHLDGDVTVFKAGRTEGIELRNSNWQPALRADNDSTDVMAPDGTAWHVQSFELGTGSCEDRLGALEAGLVALGIAVAP